ncbi:MAG: S8 family serine peptidase [Eubacteriaceae bacterium]|nr:S8 family serine peptidase [Eubacteriaceae bacterium]
MRIKRFSLFLTILLMLLSIPSVVMAQASDSVSEKTQYQPGEAIVCLTRSPTQSMADDELLGSSESLLTLPGTSDGIKTAGDGSITEWRLERSASLSTEELIKQLRAKPGVRYAEPNYIFNIEQTADSAPAAFDVNHAAGTQTQADASDSVYTGDFTFLQYANAGENSIDVPDWNNPAKVNADGIVVAVLDTGVNYAHEDLAPVMWDKGLDYPELTAMGGGKYGFNTLKENSKGVPYDSADPMDDHSHGSHCAGSIGAAWNGKGVSGAANGVKIMSVKIALDDGNTPLANIIKGFHYVIAAKKAGVNVKVTSNSYGGTDLSLAYNDVIKEAGKLGIVSVKAAGNEATDIDFSMRDSSTFKTAPETVIVGASDAAGNPADFSNSGSRTTHVFAPGVNIFSTILSGGGTLLYGVSKPEEGTEDSFDPAQKRLYSVAPTDASFTDRSGEQPQTYVAKAEDAAVAVESGKGWQDTGAMVVTSAEGKNTAIHITGAGGKSSAFLTKIKMTTDGELYLLDQHGALLNHTRLKAGQWTDWNSEAKNIDDTTIFLFHPKTEGTPYELAMDGIYFSSDKPDYGMKSGTSMATPAVAGEAAILCAAYPDDSADEIAARVKGSVNPKETLTGLCTSDGIASTAKALAGETVPVLNDCLKTDDGTCTLNGYFFGGQSGTLTVDGKAVQPTSWSNTAITFAYNDSLMKGEHIYEVSSSVGIGRQYFTLQNSDDLMDRLPTPDDELFKNSLVTSSCGLDGKIYFVMHDDAKRISSLWTYTPGDGGWAMVSSKLPFDMIKGKICAWNHKLLVPCLKSESSTSLNNHSTENIAVYDPKTGDTRYIDVPEGGKLSAFTLVNTGDRVFAYYCISVLGIYDQPMLGIVDARNLTFQDRDIIDLTEKTDFKNLPGTANMFFDDGGHLMTICGKVDLPNFPIYLTGLGAVNPDADLKNRMRVVTDDVFGEGFPEDQEMTPIAAEPVEGGAIISGLVKTDESGHVVADTFKLNTGAVSTAADGGDIKLEPIEKRVSDTKVSAITGTVYDNHFYTLGFTDNDMTNRVFTDYPVSGSNNAGDHYAPSIAYEVHGRDYGWEQGEKRDGAEAGTTGKALRLEAMRISVKDDAGDPIDGLGVTYRVHMKDIGWGSWTDDGLQAGTVGKCTRLEAAEIKLTGEKAGNYDIYYRVHMAYKGWGDWVKNGEMAGTTGECRRIEAIEIKIIPKGGEMPTE